MRDDVVVLTMTFCGQADLKEGPSVKMLEAFSGDCTTPLIKNTHDPQESQMPPSDEVRPILGESEQHARETTAASKNLEDTAPDGSPHVPFEALSNAGGEPPLSDSGPNGHPEALEQGASEGDTKMEDAVTTGVDLQAFQAQERGQNGTKLRFNYNESYGTPSLTRDDSLRAHIQ